MSTESTKTPGETVDTLTLNFEELEIKHKKERKDLQASIMQLKKAVPKGDKKRLKETQQRITQMEADFEKKCQEEIQQIQAQEKINCPTGPAENGDVEDGDEDVYNGGDTGVRKISKAEKRREKKRLMELERNRRIAEEEKQSEGRPRAIEDQLLKKKLAEKKMRIHQIAADGNCLFSAVAHQLLTRYGETISVMEVRRRCVHHLRQNREDFEPFLEESVDFDEYCSKMETDPSRWGGNLELRAISQEMELLITVYQAQAPPFEFGNGPDTESNSEKRHLRLSYHHHLIWTGAHYNSVVDMRPDETDGESVS
ncbi:OTU domain-containing protein 6B-like isoform X1 [Varroa jacobsoni]|uniref:OTU domain-containing protein 6B-like isoform X1 n=1 Tax=Varroa jacobsoni TaxID=62625 RepID=UPI000BF2FE08|nr:OTU domain-containing protein 6B-like isoform X1 [Varroa jacobsoni]